jgi:hypothetical protein
MTANAGLAAVTELYGRLGVAEELDAAVGPIKQRDRGSAPGICCAGSRRHSLPGRTS